MFKSSEAIRAWGESYPRGLARRHTKGRVAPPSDCMPTALMHDAARWACEPLSKKLAE